MKENDVPAHLTKTGEIITSGWKKLAEECGISIKTGGISPLPKFSFEYENSREMMTLFTQEMLERGFLARDCVYVSYSHREKDVKMYLAVAKEVFEIIRKALDSGTTLGMLKTPVANTGFKRLA